MIDDVINVPSSTTPKFHFVKYAISLKQKWYDKYSTYLCRY